MMFFVPRFLILPPDVSGFTHASITSNAALAIRYHDDLSETAGPDRELTWMAHNPSAI